MGGEGKLVSKCVSLQNMSHTDPDSASPRQCYPAVTWVSTTSKNYLDNIHSFFQHLNRQELF